MPRGAALKLASGSDTILDEAASWLALAQQRSLDDREAAELEAWRRHSEAHEKAWQAALELQRMFDGVPAEIGAEVLGRHRRDRRAVLKSLAVLAFAAPAGYAAWLHAPRLTADYRTATGERHDVTLPDGSRLALNTASAVRLEFSAGERRLVLVEGEIMVSTNPDGARDERAFIVQTRHGTVRALGTRFTVRDLDDGRTRVAVFEHAVAVRPLGAAQAHRLDAGGTLVFDAQQVFPSRGHDETGPAWSRGQLVSRNQRLEDFLAELSRYRPGLLRCDPAVAELRLSGVFQLDDTDRVLELLGETLPVRIERRTPFWVTVAAR
ncbi:FecR domain-containing protein [Wenzhouxiangella sp. XN24]|uniref:FecR domain-containing protein n=1 Tax=Wenzhouxiangella sp. XN24 TaxID=2713569 RepID=UPI0013EBAC0D|nr:FecR domain-containing protein [Wenzhouxiangella sp. XN24]NGX16044.1 Fe2+-dicitrate sensor, membrane component [Wenzhouxiangella sp. XN24]